MQEASTDTSNNSSMMDVDTTTTTPVLLSVRAVEEAVEMLLQSNFDADSAACIVTICKLLDNVLQKPGQERVRQIRLQNAAIRNKITSKKGGVELLLSCGFERDHEALGDEERLVLLPENENTSHLVMVRRLLTQRAVQDLGLKASDLPAFRQPPAAVKVSMQDPSLTKNNKTEDSESSFNVYQGHRLDLKSAAVGEHLGPEKGYTSKTEASLKALQDHQRKLEQKAAQQPIPRQWRAWGPATSAASIMAQQQQEAAAASTRRASSSDASLLAARAKQQHQRSVQRETGGMTTSAMRELERLQKQSVYSHATLTLQFPDGCKLQGQFVPHATLQTVMDAVRQDCFVEQSQQRMFDLYVTPPRRQLPPDQTLQQADLVPAAKVFVSWKNTDVSSGNSSPGSYLHSHLFVDGNPKAQPQEAAFPKATPLVAKDNGDDDDDKNAKRKATEDDAKKQPKKESKEDALLRRMMGGGGKKPSKGGNNNNGSGKPAAGGGKMPPWFKK